MEWLDWMTEKPVEAGAAALGMAIVGLALVVLVRLAFATIMRRLLVGMGLRKRLERESPWASVDDRVTYKLRPAPRRWWQFRGRA